MKNETHGQVDIREQTSELLICSGAAAGQLLAS